MASTVLANMRISVPFRSVKKSIQFFTIIMEVFKINSIIPGYNGKSPTYHCDNLSDSFNEPNWWRRGHIKQFY